MSTKATGGPAFPRPAADFCESQVGMTLRDYFAGQAHAVMCASNVSETGPFAYRHEFRFFT